MAQEGEMGAHEKSNDNKSKSKGTRALIIVVCVLVGLALLLGGTVLVLSVLGRQALTDDGTDMNLPDAEAGVVRHDGKSYKYNEDMVCILLMGVDGSRPEQDGKFGYANQSDVNMLAALDMKNNKITLISISRDSMCEMDVLDENGERTGTTTAQLALAHSFGDGGAVSCELTEDAVSRLFYDLPVSAYASIYMDGVLQLINDLGGVTVTIDEPVLGYAQGKQVTLYGKSAESFLRYRESTVDGNNGRMQRQRQVMLALMYAALDRVRQDPASIVTIYNSISDSVTTDIGITEMTYLATKAGKMSFDGEIRNVAGESVLGEYNHAEYNVDKDALYDLILDVFYEPVES
jgi:polyisoprenyl-teichoic acid--peptidoglycan teichoic acid transferase